MTYIDIADICRSSPAVGTWAPGSGSTFFFLVGAHLLVLLSIEKHRVCVCVCRLALAAHTGAGLVIALECLVPRNTELQPGLGPVDRFVLTTVSSCVMAVATVWFTLRDTARRGGDGNPIRLLRSLVSQHAAGQHNQAAQIAQPNRHRRLNTTMPQSCVPTSLASLSIAREGNQTGRSGAVAEIGRAHV